MQTTAFLLVHSSMEKRHSIPAVCTDETHAPKHKKNLPPKQRNSERVQQAEACLKKQAERFVNRGPVPCATQQKPHSALQTRSSTSTSSTGNKTEFRMGEIL